LIHPKSKQMKTIIKLLLVMVISTSITNQNDLKCQQQHGVRLITKRDKISRTEIMNESGHPIFHKKFPNQAMAKFLSSDRQKLDSVIYEYLDENTAQLTLDYKNECFYNLNANTIQIKGFSWNESLNQWIYSDSTEFTYDINGNMIQYVYYFLYSEPNEWIIEEKEEYSFDSKNNLINYIEYAYDETTNQMVKYHKQSFIRDADGNIIEEQNYNWDNNVSDWTQTYKWVYVISDKGQVTQNLSFYWEQDSGWILMEKIEFSYDSYGNRTQSISYFGATLEQTGKYEYSYDDDGNLIQFINYQWNENNNEWIVIDNQEFIYDAKGNITKDVDYDWIDSLSNWVSGWQEEFDFNYSYSIEDLMVPEGYHEMNYLSVPMKNMVVQYRFSSWDDIVSQWVVEEKMYFYYSGIIPTGKSTDKESFINVYPNPAKDYIVFQLKNSLETATIEIYDIKGDNVVWNEFQGSANLFVGNLSGGFYLYKLSIKNNNKILFGKIIIK
jgi:hypothetical protein